MHFNFDFSSRQVLWTLTFAAQLVLLVVLLGRDRVRRYPWFTASIVLFALHLMTEVLLSGRMAMLPLQEIFLGMAALAAIVALLVVVEMARQAFAGAPRSLWIANTVGLLLVAGGILTVWGPWPVWKQMAMDTLLGKLRLMQLVEQKTDTMVALLTVGLGLLVVLFGRHFKAGWRSHTQMIVIGLWTVAIASLGIQESWRIIIRTMHPHTQQEYQHIIGLGSKLMNANDMVYIAVLVWWIVWLWLDEPGAAETALEVADSNTGS
jgi:hypothetical protein